MKKALALIVRDFSRRQVANLTYPTCQVTHPRSEGSPRKANSEYRAGSRVSGSPGCVPVPRLTDKTGNVSSSYSTYRQSAEPSHTPMTMGESGGDMSRLIFSPGGREAETGGINAASGPEFDTVSMAPYHSFSTLNLLDGISDRIVVYLSMHNTSTNLN